jgi:MerR family transcriptional regulator, copper efflux regulator
VSELARRAGVTPSAVRFYERSGLLAPARRSANGYRVFDEAAVDQLMLVARAKRIGMSLEDISSLTAAWPGGECRSVQARIQQFLAERVRQVREQKEVLMALERRLLTALARLPTQDPGSRRCAPGCGCDAALDADPGSASVDAGAAPLDTGAAPLETGAAPPDGGAAASASRGQGPWGCTLDPAALVSRLSEWRALAAAATSVEHADDAVRLTLPAEPAVVASAAALCAAETACCNQTRFLLEVTAGQVTLTARAPGAPGLVEAMIPA